MQFTNIKHLLIQGNWETGPVDDWVPIKQREFFGVSKLDVGEKFMYIHIERNKEIVCIDMKNVDMFKIEQE